MQTFLKLSQATIFLTIFVPYSAFAYIGPGAGVTAIGALWAVILALFFALAGLLIWPIKIYLMRRKQKQNKSSITDE